MLFVLCLLRFVISFQYAKLLAKIYQHPDDVDLIVGGNLEDVIKDTLGGPTFTCIWLKQFKNIRKGDRFFYERKNGPFTLEQLKEIRKTSVSRWFCDNSNNIKYMQPNGFLSISSK